MKQNKFILTSQAALKFVKKNLPSIMALASSVGVVLTTGFAIRGTIKTVNLIEKKEKRYGRKLNKAEIAKTAAPAFISTFVIGGTTIACIFAGDRLHVKREMAIGSAYAMISKAYQDYRQEVKHISGEDVDKEALASVHKEQIEKQHISRPEGEKLLFFEEISGKYFNATMLEVVDAEYHFNRNYWLRGGEGSLNEFYDFLGIPRTPAGDILGWSTWWGEAFYGYTWVDFDHTLVTLDDGLECYILSYPFAPTANYDGCLPDE